MTVKAMRAYACPFFGFSNHSRPSNASMMRPTKIEIVSVTVRAIPAPCPSTTRVLSEPRPVAEIGHRALRCVLQITVLV